MKPSRWILVICTLSVALLMVLPAADAADTSFNEADATIFLAAPSLLRVRSLARPALSSSVPAETLPEIASASTSATPSLETTQTECALNRQQLLCTFRI